MKALAVQDSDFFRLIIDFLPFETTFGRMTLKEFREKNSVLRYVSSHDQYRQISGVAAAQGEAIINGGYVYDSELLERFSELYPVEQVDAAGFAQTFEDIILAERESVFDLLQTADQVLRPFQCATDIKKYHELLKQTPTGRLSNCAACVQNSEVSYAVHILGQDNTAFEKAKPILSGKLRCVEVPHLTYGTLLLPLLRLNQPEEAARLHKIGYKLVSNSTALLGTISDHLLFLGITGEIAKAIQLLEKHFTPVFRAPDLNYRFQFYKAAKFLTERILLSNLKSIKIRMPKTFPDYKENGNYAVIDLDSWFGKEASRLASQFDSRNGNDSYMEDLKGLKAFHELSQKHLQENNQ
ncbi:MULTISPECIES: hypothetical protein [Leptospira]|uniref:hypothetical protein n=1 Tax=Leptospira TaxID=171 RepID=UPI0004A32E6B|nr:MULTISPECIES: hypothetical protein [Leptospira]KXZ20362.1 hypothetical protein AYB32_07510 [Leptospira kirschneri]KXZ25147.1 hypothetical protein AYB34_06395 [Leptospira sp. ZV016]